MIVLMLKTAQSAPCFSRKTSPPPPTPPEDDSIFQDRLRTNSRKTLKREAIVRLHSVVGYVAELSTPFTNMRWLLKECWQGGTNSRAYLVNGVLMAVVFFGCRVIGMAVLLYMMFVTCEWHPHTYHPRLPACRMVYSPPSPCLALPFPVLGRPLQ